MVDGVEIALRYTRQINSNRFLNQRFKSEGSTMIADDIPKGLETLPGIDDGIGKNGHLSLSPTSFPELLIYIKSAFSVDKTKREIACDLCKIVLASLNERPNNIQMDICVLLGRIEGYDLLKLKGAAGFQPNGMLAWKNFKFGEGIVGQAARDITPISTNDLRNDPRGASEFESDIVPLAEKVAILAYPLVLADGELVGILVLGKFHSGAVTESHFWQPDFIKMIEWLAPHLATTFNYAIWLAKAKRLKQYHENERCMRATAKKFYSAAVPDLNLLMEAISIECMKILNRGNPEQPFYQNFLFYEYQKYRKLFVLRSCGRRPKSVLSSFHVKSRHYKEFVQDGRVKCLESQAKFVSNRGKAPYVIRSLFENKLEEIIPKLDANWSPAGSGTAFIVPLFENAQPLGALVFWSRKQHRQYVNKPE
ncbi:GAF domain-containing protein, partial [bacterium]|nr:GAF domain-containing protein [bacterium]